MRGCGIPRGFWLKPGGSVDRVEGIIIETFVILCQYNSQIHRVPAGRIVTNKQTKKRKFLLAYGIFLDDSPIIVVRRRYNNMGVC
jgi:hypothetical protein